MDRKILLWINELKRCNPMLNLVGPGMLATIEQDVAAMLPMLEHISEPVIADIGSGSGLPAIPYKVLHPQSYVALIERSTKKCTFLRHIIDLLGMEGMELIETDPLIADIRRFDAVLSRSFSPLSKLEKTVLRILSGNGRFYYLFTGSSAPELGTQFHLQELVTRETPGYTLNLGVFRIIPG